MTPPALSLHGLTVSYERRPVLWNIDARLPQGQLIGILGPNGSGKTTLLKTALGLLTPDAGTVRFWGQPLPQVRRRVAYVPQRSMVDWDFPATAADVVLMGTYGQLGLFRSPGRTQRQRAAHALEQVALGQLAHRQIAQLSGGQQQRVFLARALAQDADLLLMDEPFAGVDMATENLVMDLLRTLRDAGKTIVVVHHDLRTAPDYFQWLVMLNQRLVTSGPTAEVFTPENLTAAYGGRLTMLEALGQELHLTDYPRRKAHPELNP